MEIQQENSFEILLNQVSEISNKYDEEAKKTGEHFNVFKILGLSTDEVKTHTAFLKELLDPKGSHGQGDVFLKLFLKILNVDFSLIDIQVQKEFPIGIINDDWTQGGNLDILIRNSSNQYIVIENKINAGDQRNQLLRYHNYINNSQGSKLIYLTLDGREPSQFSTGGFEFEYIKVSYNIHILKWLDQCYKVEGHSIVKQTILQYINLIKTLTNNSNEFIMNNEIIKLIAKNSNTYESAKIISEAINELEANVIPGNANQAIINRWNGEFGPNNGQLVLFSIDNYEFKVSISDEIEFHLQITPWQNTENGSIFGVANNEEIRGIKEIVRLDDIRTYDNQNYTMWYYSNLRFSNLPIERYLSLYNPDNATSWSEEIVLEAVGIIRRIICRLNASQYQQSIDWNINNTRIKSLLQENFVD